MNKNDFVAAVAEKAGVDAKTAGAVVNAFEDVVVESVAKGESIGLTGFLTFEKAHKAASTARNPRTGEAIAVPAKSVPKVKVGASFKKAVL